MRDERDAMRVKWVALKARQHVKMRCPAYNKIVCSGTTALNDETSLFASLSWKYSVAPFGDMVEEGLGEKEKEK